MIKQKLLSLCQEVLKIAHGKLLAIVPYLSLALHELTPVPVENGTMATDGSMLFYEPCSLIRSVKESPDSLLHALMHILLHCLFRHMMIGRKVDPALWDLACDMAVEATMADMGLPFQSGKGKPKLPNIKPLTAEHIYSYFMDHPLTIEEQTKYQTVFTVDDHSKWYLREKNPENQKSEVSLNKSDNESDDSCNNRPKKRFESQPSSGAPSNTAQLSQSGGSDEDENGHLERDNPAKTRVDTSEDLFEGLTGNGDLDQGSTESNETDRGSDSQSLSGNHDDHLNPGLDSIIGSTGVAARGTRSNGRSEQADENCTLGDNCSIPNHGKEGKAADKTAATMYCFSGITSEQQQRWRDISESVLVNLETFSHHCGNRAASLVQALQAVNRTKVDYSSFLRRFAARTEVLHTSPDEFDHNYYTFGLSLYKDTPLIEPLEYYDDKRIRELVIAIDTSGSVAGDMVQAFLQKTYDIIMQENSFARKFVIHIVQCDDEIQTDTVISSQAEFTQCLETLTLRGFGRTDFRPVFEYVNRLRKEGQLTKLKGLLYFTDGKGVFPAHKPDYDTAFVFIDSNATAAAKVPAWAIKVVLDPDDIKTRLPSSKGR